VELFSHQAKVAGVDFMGIVMAAHHTTGGCDEARRVLLEWAAQAGGYADHGWSVGRRSDSLDSGYAKPLTAGTIGMVLKAVMGEKPGALLLADVKNRIDLETAFAEVPIGDVQALLAPSEGSAGTMDTNMAEALGIVPKKPEPISDDEEAEYDEHGNLLGFGPFRTMLGMMRQPKGGAIPDSWRHPLF
jgi:hypothetical protein